MRWTSRYSASLRPRARRSSTKCAARGTSSDRPATSSDPPGYERLQPGAAWCAPRALYFLARYCGEECSLESAVAACESDDEGRTTLAGLVRAAESLRLDPRPIHCTPDELARISG